jgi:hypothetical protein
MELMRNPQPEHREPYGKAPALLALRAVDLLHDLSDVPEWSEGKRWQWVQSDRLALHGWYSLELETLDAFTEPDLSRNQVGDMLSLLSDFRATLPFDEAEGNWLLDAYGDAFTEGQSAPVSHVRRHKPEVIVSRGLHRVVDSRDLLRRWWSWRRDTDEFAGQSGVDFSREALRKMIDTLTPGRELPSNYKTLHNP